MKSYKKKVEIDEPKTQSDLSSSYKCLICQDIVVEPVELKCSHLFCHSCITKHLSLHNTCPVDGKRISPRSIKVSTKIREKLGTMNCPCENYGCPVVLTLIQRQQIQEHKTQCQYLPAESSELINDDSQVTKAKPQQSQSQLLPESSSKEPSFEDAGEKALKNYSDKQQETIQVRDDQGANPNSSLPEECEKLYKDLLEKQNTIFDERRDLQERNFRDAMDAQVKSFDEKLKVEIQIQKGIFQNCFLEQTRDFEEQLEAEKKRHQEELSKAVNEQKRKFEEAFNDQSIINEELKGKLAKVEAKVDENSSKDIMESKLSRELINWTRNLPVATVVNWSDTNCIMNSPNDLFKAILQGALISLGCPPLSAETLSRNCERSYWPKQLQTANKKTWRSLVITLNKLNSRKINHCSLPGSVIVVLLVENQHVPVDFIMDPGFAMLFSRGIR